MTLTELRNAKDLTIRELAAKLDVKPSYLSDVERGLVPVAGDHAFFTKLALALGVPLMQAVRACRLSAEKGPEPELKGDGILISCGSEGCRISRVRDGKEISFFRKQLPEDLREVPK